jgi:hypothetical protein
MLKTQNNENNPLENTSKRVANLIAAGKKFGKGILSVAILVASLSGTNAEARSGISMYNTSVIEQMQKQVPDTIKTGAVISNFGQLKGESQQRIIMGVYSQLMNTQIDIEINNNSSEAFTTILKTLLDKTLTDNEEVEVQMEILELITSKLIENNIIKVNSAGTIAVASYDETFINQVINDLEKDLNGLYASKGIKANIEVHGTVQQLITAMDTSGVIKKNNNNS